MSFSNLFVYPLDEERINYLKAGPQSLAYACIEGDAEKLKSTFSMRRANLVHPPSLLCKQGNLSLLKLYYKELLEEEDKQEIHERGITLHTAARHQHWDIIEWLTTLPPLTSISKREEDVLFFFCRLFYENIPDENFTKKGVKYERNKLVRQVENWIYHSKNDESIWQRKKRKILAIINEEDEKNVNKKTKV